MGTVLDTQDRILSALAAPGGLAPDGCDRIDTHLSTILMTPDRVYKAMRAVAYEFVDFRDLSARRRACFAEIAVNRAADRLYLRAVPVVASPSGPQIGDASDPSGAIEWLVEMRRFRADSAFDQMISRNALSLAHVESLADIIADTHATAPRRPDRDVPAQTETVIENCARAMNAMARSRKDKALADQVERWRRQAASIRSDHVAYMSARARRGCVRRCHGDLHLGNICLFEDRPTPFDAIAFNDALSDIDLLYDVAFTYMDLLFRNRADLASAFVSRYLSSTQDYRGLRLWPLFVSIRSAVRGMISALSNDPDACAKYLELALRSLEPTPSRRLVAIGGASGSGKSTLARALAARMGGVVLRSDVTRKRLLGVAPESPAPKDSYTQAVSDQVYSRQLANARRGLNAGAVVILDAAFLRHGERRAAAQLAAALGTPFHGFWIDVDVEIRQRRVSARRHDASDADAAVAAAQAPDPIDDLGWRVLDGGGDAEKVAANASKLLRIER
ncbi:MAG: AAA family ATPase [Pseudomonadota bacterium]